MLSVPGEILAQIINSCDDLSRYMLSKVSIFFDSTIMTTDKRPYEMQAAEEGYINILIYLCDNLGMERITSESCLLAASKGHFEVVKWYISKGLVWDKYGMSISAEAGSNLDMIKWLATDGYISVETLCIEAVKNNNHEVVMWCSNVEGISLRPVCSYAAHIGDLELLKRASARCSSLPCDVFSNAARGGHFELLKWCVNRGKPSWNWGTLADVVRGGHLDILKWCLANGCRYISKVSVVAAEESQFEILKWLITNKYDADTLVCATLATSGNLEMIKWCLDNGCGGISCSTSIVVARNGHLHILEWLLANRFSISRETARVAAKHGHFDIVKWAHDKGIRSNEIVCESAANHGHVDILEWALSNGYSYEFVSTWNIASNGHLNVLKLLRRKGYVIDYDLAYSRAAAMHHFDIVVWLMSIGYSHDGGKAILSACHEYEGNIHVLSRLKDSGCLWLPEACELLAYMCQVDALRWCLANKCDTSRACEGAARGGHLKLLKWLRSVTCYSIFGLESEWDTEVCRVAAINGHLNIVE